MTNYPRSHPAPEPVSVSVRIFSGNVHISGANVTEATVDLRPSEPGDTKADKVIERSRVEFSDRSVDVDIPKPGASLFGGRTPSVDVQVTVPLSSTARIEAGSAGVVVDQGMGEVDVQSGSGDVFVEDCAGVFAKTGSGDVRMHNLTGATATTGSGDISVTSCAGDIDVNTASGDIEIDDISSKARAKTASGDIVVNEVESEVNLKTASGAVAVHRANAGTVGATTVSGGITIGVVEGTAAMLDCSSVTGRLTSELDGIESPENNDRTVAISARSVSGGIGIVRARK